MPTHTTTSVYAGAWIVTLNLLCGVPAHTTTLVHPHGKEACVKMRAYQNTHYVPVHNIAVNPPTGKKRVSRCVRITTHITWRFAT